MQAKIQQQQQHNNNHHFMAIIQSTCISQHLQLRTGDFVGAKFYCQHALADGFGLV